MLDEQNRDAEAIADGVDAIQQFCGLGGIHTGGWLVKQQELHVCCERARDLQLALLTVGQVCRDIVRFILQMKDGKQVECLFFEFFFRLPEARGAEKRIQHAVVNIFCERRKHVFQHGHLLKEADVLEGTRDAGRDKLMRLFTVKHLTIE